MAAQTALGISVSQLKARLRDNPIGAFAFYGPEELLKQFYLQKFIALIEKEGTADFNIARLDFTRDHTMDDLLGEAEILPFCGEKRLVICRGLSPAKISDSDGKRFAELLKSFPSYLILVIYTNHEEFGSDKKELKKKSVLNLSENLTFVNFCLQDERVLLPWAKKILAADSLTASDRALRTLFRLAGSRMQIIRSELEKLSAYANAKKKSEVTEEDVLLFAEDTTEFATYNLCDAVLEGAVNAVEKILTNLKKQDVHPVMIAGALATMLTGAMLVAEGASAADCQKAAKVLPWQYDKYRRSLYGKKKENVEKALFLCLELDGKLKGARSDIWIVTEIYVLQMARILGGAV
ncbi:MAG: DNA polymerase III subunit delta [Ruminococcaceae bacterium]|nr:DNA polymerase III subunit delta [Oscillospiraceae bacterium]